MLTDMLPRHYRQMAHEDGRFDGIIRVAFGDAVRRRAGVKPPGVKPGFVGTVRVVLRPAVDASGVMAFVGKDFSPRQNVRTEDLGNGRTLPYRRKICRAEGHISQDIGRLWLRRGRILDGANQGRRNTMSLYGQWRNNDMMPPVGQALNISPEHRRQ